MLGYSVSLTDPHMAGDMGYSREEEFPQLQGNVYLDHAGATLYAKSQIDAWNRELTSTLFANPHSRHGPSHFTSAEIGKVRRRILAHFNTDSSRYSVIFTSGASAALKLIAETFDFGVSGALAHLREVHTSVLGMREVAASRGASIHCFLEIDVGPPPRFPHSTGQGGHLAAFSGQCNFSGRKYPLKWVEWFKETGWRVVLDAAALVGTSELDLAKVQPDFVVMSFYKMFGFPTGLGAVLVHRDAEWTLKKVYFGGGTVDVAVGEERFHVFRQELHQRFEDGTVNFLDILALNHGFRALERLGGGMRQISDRTFSLAQYAFTLLAGLRHHNGGLVCEIYCQDGFTDPQVQGSVVTFNLKKSSGEYVGFMAVEKVMEAFNIQLRTGCFCNTGACQKYLGLSTESIKENYKAGHVCGDSMDIIGGLPTGAIRISLGYMSEKRDVDYFVQVISRFFVEKSAGSMDVSRPSNSGVRRVSAMFMYPVKSCRGVQIERWPFGEEGFLFDRACFIQNSLGTCVTLKHNPRLSDIHPEVDLENRQLILSAPGLSELRVKLRQSNANGVLTAARRSIADGQNDAVVSGRICGRKVQAVNCETESQDWLNSFLLDDQYTLMRYLTRADRSLSFSHSAANSAPFLLVCTASVDCLLKTIPAPHEFSVEHILARLRPNLVVGTDLPFEEDHWEDIICVGGRNFQVVEKCSRCQMVNIDPQTGKRSGEILQAIIKLRGKEMNFGLLIRPADGNDGDGQLAVNDVVQIGICSDLGLSREALFSPTV